MAKLNIIRPPKVNIETRKTFWKQLRMLILGTTISLVLTITAAVLMEKHQRAKDRKLTTMMVTNNIDGYWRTLEVIHMYTGRTDSVAQWLLSRPVEDLEMLPEEELDALVEEATCLYVMSFDNTVEKIFTNSIDTWKNMRKYRYIEIVGLCFAKMNSTAERWNQLGAEFEAIKDNIKAHPDQYPGKSTSSKFLRNNEARLKLADIHNQRCWLLQQSRILHYENLKAMAIMGISEKKLQKFYDKEMANDPVVDMEEPTLDYDRTPLNPDNLTTLATLDARLDSLMGR